MKAHAHRLLVADIAGDSLGKLRDKPSQTERRDLRVGRPDTTGA